MVVISAALTTKAGKPLMARQFVDISRMRIEGLLAAFPKLIGTGKQHTFVETESIRYVYQPLENLYLLLITNKSSNIMEDLETLKVLAKIVPEFCPMMDEESVADTCFDLIFAFDEVLAMGHRENVSLTQVKTAIEMESHEEKIANMIKQSKMNEAKEEAKRKAHSIDKMKAERQKAGLDKFGGTGGISSQGFGSGGGGGGGGGGMSSMFDDEPTVAKYEEPVQRAPPPRAAPPKSKGKSLVLGGKNKQADLMRALQDEGEISEAPARGGAAKAAPAAGGGGGRAKAPQQAITIEIEEKLVCTMSREGGIEDVEVKGDLKLTVNDADAAMTRVQIRMGDTSGFQFKTHPNINKALWASESVLSHKDPPRPFPTGNPIGILKWRAVKEESLVPLTLSCWPSLSGNTAVVTLEYELVGSVPVWAQVVIPCSGQPSVQQVDGSHNYNAREQCLEWEIGDVGDDNKNGTFEFSVANADIEQFFPIRVLMSSEASICDVEVESVTDSREGNNVEHTVSKTLEAEDFQVV